MQPFILHNTIAGVLFAITVVVSYLFDGALTRRWRAQGENPPEWSFFFVVVVVTVCQVGAAVAAIRHVAPIPGALWWPVAAGIILIWAAMAFRAWAVFTLGHFFKLMVVIQEDHRVIDRGPYRWLRHPGYLAIIVGSIGFGLGWGDWSSVAIMFVGSFVAFAIRIQIEERALRDGLGEEYAAYASRTAKLIPGVF